MPSPTNKPSKLDRVKQTVALTAIAGSLGAGVWMMAPREDVPAPVIEERIATQPQQPLRPRQLVPSPVRVAPMPGLVADTAVAATPVVAGQVVGTPVEAVQVVALRAVELPAMAAAATAAASSPVLAVNAAAGTADTPTVADLVRAEATANRDVSGAIQVTAGGPSAVAVSPQVAVRLQALAAADTQVVQPGARLATLEGKSIELDAWSGYILAMRLQADDLAEQIAREAGWPRFSTVNPLPDNIRAVLALGTTRDVLGNPTALALQDAAGAPYQVVVFHRNQRDPAAWVKAHPGKQFILVSVLHEITDDFIAVAGLPQVKAIVLGHALNADLQEHQYAEAAQRLEQHRVAMRSLTSAPLLLSVSYVNVEDYDSKYQASARWVQSFPDGGHNWDGFAVHNINGFAWFEAGTLEEARSQLGIPQNKPVILWEFVGTRKVVDDRVRLTWRYKWPALKQKIESQGWAGIVLWAQGRDDAEFKGGLLR